MRREPQTAPAIARASASNDSGQARLSAWLRARGDDRVAALEEALLGGRFWRFALRRLWVFLFARGWATALHVVELTFLAEIFSARPFVASLALQNATLVIDAFWWGALEGLRRRVRAIGVRADAQVLTTRYMTFAFWAGLLGCGVPVARAAWRWHSGMPPTMLDAYALVCLLRLALEMVLRAFYSGVYAYGRVHRPAWAAPIAPTLLVGLTVALWPWLGGWSFVVALLVSVLGSRALLGWFSLRAYRLAHVPLPAWRWRWPGRTFDFRLVGDSALAGTANLTTRLASVVLLGAVIPSLGAADAEVQLVAFVLHLAAPLVLVTTQWSYIFYHDWKRLEADSAAILARQLHRGLLAVGAWVAVGAWAVTALLVRAFTGGDGPWAVVAPIVFALAPAYLGLSIWTALQLRGFSRGEFVSQALSAAVVMGSVLAAGIAIGTSGGGLPDGDVRIWYITLAACPWIAVVAHAILARGLRAPDARAATTLNAWVQRLRRQRRPVAVWRARLAGPRAAAITVEVGRLLASRGQVLAWHGWLLAFERGAGRSRDEWLVRCAGLVTAFDLQPAASGARAVDEMVRKGWLAPPVRDAAEAALAREHERLFPGGFSLRVGHRPPAAFRALPADVRQAIWRDAVRRVAGGKHRASAASPAWQVSACAPDGALTQVFVRPRVAGVTVERAAQERAWAERLQQSSWRISYDAGGEG
jgi:hypothetical protein